MPTVSKNIFRVEAWGCGLSAERYFALPGVFAHLSAKFLGAYSFNLGYTVVYILYGGVGLVGLYEHFVKRGGCDALFVEQCAVRYVEPMRQQLSCLFGFSAEPMYNPCLCVACLFRYCYEPLLCLHQVYDKWFLSGFGYFHMGKECLLLPCGGFCCFCEMKSALANCNDIFFVGMAGYLVEQVAPVGCDIAWMYAYGAMWNVDLIVGAVDNGGIACVPAVCMYVYEFHHGTGS